MLNVTALNHPFITHKLSSIRDKSTSSGDFRRLVREVSVHLAYQALKSVPLHIVTIDTPLQSIQSGRVDDSSILLVSILRAGNGLLDGFLELAPNARVRHLGLARDEQTLQPKEYYSNLASASPASAAIVLDPMLATGGSAAFALERIRALKVPTIKLVSLISAPEGIRLINTRFPEVEIVTAAVDTSLNERGYIVPGLGDAGDRLTNC